jgi:hypothetical protein
MANNKINEHEDILIKVDQNNLIYVDPNSVVVDGQIEARGIKQENLVTYVNLEADLVPRTTLIADGNKTSMTSIASGTLNFMKKNGGDDYDTKWTDSFYNNHEKIVKDENGKMVGTGQFYQNDDTAQTFGIDSININIKGGGFIPQININFIDVRGKTLFESPENSPYKAFFHLPWPIFYLTVKGYYGKAIRYRLHMTKFTSKFSENGNFEVSTTFVGSTYAFLSDIPLLGILNAPYMFLSEKDKKGKFNPKTNRIEKTISRTSRGFVLLKSVYDEYIQKGYLPKDFNARPRTLREIITIASSLDRILEREIFDQKVDFRLLSGIKEFETNITAFRDSVESWANVHLSNDFFVENGVDYFKLAPNENSSLKNVQSSDSKDTNTLEYLVFQGTERLKNTKSLIDKIREDQRANFDNKKEFDLRLNTTIHLPVIYYVRPNSGTYGVAKDEILKDIDIISNSFVEQRNKVIQKVEEEMNKIIRDKDKGIGFEPTIQNIFGVIMANAEVYIRLMKDTHRKAFSVGKERLPLIGKLSDESIGDSIYPWPEIKKLSSSQQKILAYPRDPDLEKKLQSNDPRLWPEIDFLENYYAVGSKKLDTLAEKEGGIQNISYVFSNDEKNVDTPKISSLFQLMNFAPYISKDVTSLVYEMWERSKYITLIDSFNNESIKELANVEFEILQNLLEEDVDVINVIKEINTQEKLRDKLKTTSPFERYPYYQDELPTTEYIQRFLNRPFKIEQYDGLTNNVDTNSKFTKLSDNIINYKVEDYRMNIYPFNSDEYLSYINQPQLLKDNFKFDGILSVNTTEGLVVSYPKGSAFWIKDNLDGSWRENIFSQKLKVKNTSENILNTPYFHKQLYSDFTGNTSLYGKYVGSAYLLLNSLPFRDLSDKWKGGSGNPIIAATLKEIGASHHIPYHLILKWGSLYHRYKTYLTQKDGLGNPIDIIGTYEINNILHEGVLNGTTTTQINGINFYDIAGFDTTYPTYDYNTSSTKNVNYGGTSSDCGFHPYYQSIYNKIINGYPTFDYTATGFTSGTTLSSGKLHYKSKVANGYRYWTSFVNNKQISSTENIYTLLPSDGYNSSVNFKNNSVDSARQSNFRIIWEDSQLNDTYDGLSFPGFQEYNLSYNSTNRDLDNQYSITNNNREIYDLIATFSPSLLDEFEKLFLDFATEKSGEQMPLKIYSNIKHDNFISLLKEMTTIPINSTDSNDFDELVKSFKTKQTEKLKTITQDIINDSNLLKITIGNPKEIDSYAWAGLSELDKNMRFEINPYDEGQYNSVNQKLIKLYVGSNPDMNADYYKDFFVVNDVELIEDNILLFRPLIHIFAGYVNDLVVKYKKEHNNTLVGFIYPTKSDFQTYIKNNVYLSMSGNTGGSVLRHSLFLTTLTSKLSTLKPKLTEQTLTADRGYNETILKLELYNFFKSFNDKWVAGNSLGQRLLIEEFMFLDKSNKYIGNLAYLTLDKLLALENINNSKQNLYGVISMLIQDTGFDMRAMPAYVNFYGTNYSSKGKVNASKKMANNLFGTFLDVDHEESSPKMVVQYSGPTSKRLEMKDISDKNLFRNDSFDIGDANNNPLIITIPGVFSDGDMTKSNKVVAFEVSIGDQNQGIFKSVQLDQSSIKNTTESFAVLENLGRSENGAGVQQIDTSLFDIYRTASYTCDVTCLGNVMIQPTMYFYLKNVPLFRGTYWITEVTHNIKGNNITTSFKGTRIPQASLPNPKDSFMASYRALFDKITAKAQARQNEADRMIAGPKANETTINTPAGNLTIDTGDAKNIINGEKLVNDAGMNQYGVRFNGYNGEKYIQKVTLNGVEYFRAVAVKMGSTNYEIKPETIVNMYNYTKNIIVTGATGNVITWAEVQKLSPNADYYSLRFDLPNIQYTPAGNHILSSKITLFNPKKMEKTVTIDSLATQNVVTPINVKGPINIGPNVTGYGIALSNQLAWKLGVGDGDVVYFQME